jgi:hypothetical protein
VWSYKINGKEVAQHDLETSLAARMTLYQHEFNEFSFVFS